MLHIIQRSVELFFQSINQSNSRSKHIQNMGSLKTRLYFTTTTPQTLIVLEPHTQKKYSQDEFSQEWSEGDWRGGGGG